MSSTAIVRDLIARAMSLTALPAAIALGPLGLVPVIVWSTIGAFIAPRSRG